MTEVTTDRRVHGAMLSWLESHGERAYAETMARTYDLLYRTGVLTQLPRWLNRQPPRVDLPLVLDGGPDRSADFVVAPSFRHHVGGPLPPEIAGKLRREYAAIPAPPSVWVEDPRTAVLAAYALPAPLDHDPALASLVPGAPPAGLAPDLAAALARAGALVDPARAAHEQAAFAARLAEDGARYREDGFVILRDLLTPGHLAALRAYSRALPTATRLHQDLFSGRLVERNEPAAKYLQHQFRGFVSRFVGKEVASTFTYSMWYRKGARLNLHTDTPFCEYTLNFVVDQDPPDPAGWPLCIVSRSGRVVELHLAAGDALLFRGYELPHFRPRLKHGRGATGVMFHYVDHDFAGPLVYFTRKSAALPPSAHEAVDHWARVLADHPEVLKIELRGHVEAGERGSTLARERAESVARALVGRGAAPARLVVTGVDQPLPDDGTKAARANNRRVHVSILERRRDS